MTVHSITDALPTHTSTRSTPTRNHIPQPLSIATRSRDLSIKISKQWYGSTEVAAANVQWQAYQRQQKGVRWVRPPQALPIASCAYRQGQGQIAVRRFAMCDAS